jgi:LysR family cys regulon transcriptional activator
MRLAQLRFLREIARQKFSISRAAEAVHTSQPSISKQIRLLEQELGADLLHRYRGKVIGLTPTGAAVLEVAQRMLSDADRIVALPAELNQSAELVIATTHLHARYVLPEVLEQFRRQYSRMRVSLLQSTAGQTVELVTSGVAAVGITSEPPDGFGQLQRIHCFDLRRVLITQPRHPLLTERSLTLEQIAEYPLVSYNPIFPGGFMMQKAFERKGLQPRVVISASDSEIVKTYVRLGFGIAVLPSLAFDRGSDRDLRAVDVDHLFERSSVNVIVPPAPTLPVYVQEFVRLVVARKESVSPSDASVG